MTLTKALPVSVSTIAGYRVRSFHNQDLGMIEEIIIHPDSGRIAFAVLCFGGTFNFGDRLFAVPWERLHVDAEDRVLMLDWDPNHLDGAPSFEQENWPDFTDEIWERQIHDYYAVAR